MCRYTVSARPIEGKFADEFIADIGPFPTMSAARQAMLKHARTHDLPDEEPFFAPSYGILEGWIIGRTEYRIGYDRQWAAQFLEANRDRIEQNLRWIRETAKTRQAAA